MGCAGDLCRDAAARHSSDKGVGVFGGPTGASPTELLAQFPDQLAAIVAYHSLLGQVQVLGIHHP